MNYGLTKTRARLACGAALVALSGGAALAQEGVEQVIVSSTRLQAAGFDAPTLTTVISSADLEAGAKALGCDDDKARFEAKLGKLAKAKGRPALKAG